MADVTGISITRVWYTWPLGARLVAEGHVTVWRRIAEEWSGGVWCLRTMRCGRAWSDWDT